ncbi:hypothetical protein FHX37_3851 [Haloactinospora alba]|uniref:Uncharacterized protein n=1 Tax=Haloactinospora alba TaxID=405555 RepID=A0A543N9K1_9ACTN|nr:hypothetical protein [Haloactinospora alba]TQN28506.1 hypothetical protein FHX37_3851 [Haloactinospora alba]
MADSSTRRTQCIHDWQADVLCCACWPGEGHPHDWQPNGRCCRCGAEMEVPHWEDVMPMPE